MAFYGFDGGKDLGKGKNDKEILEVQQFCASQGEEGAIYAIAERYENGDGVESDLTRAVSQSGLLATKYGNWSAVCKLAELYRSGKLSGEDAKKVVSFCTATSFFRHYFSS
jgi:TPR repeat protein